MSSLNIYELLGYSSEEEFTKLLAQDFTQRLSSCTSSTDSVGTDLAQHLGILSGISVSMASEMAVSITNALLIKYDLIDPSKALQ